jgi:hypothetical protein
MATDDLTPVTTRDRSEEAQRERVRRVLLMRAHQLAQQIQERVRHLTGAAPERRQRPR